MGQTSIGVVSILGKMHDKSVVLFTLGEKHQVGVVSILGNRHDKSIVLFTL